MKNIGSRSRTCPILIVSRHRRPPSLRPPLRGRSCLNDQGCRGRLVGTAGRIGGDRKKRGPGYWKTGIRAGRAPAGGAGGSKDKQMSHESRLTESAYIRLTEKVPWPGLYPCDIFELRLAEENGSVQDIRGEYCAVEVEGLESFWASKSWGHCPIYPKILGEGHGES